MDASLPMNSNGTIGFARDITIKAIENNLLTPSTDPIETAKIVTDFYKTVLNTINSNS